MNGLSQQAQSSLLEQQKTIGFETPTEMLKCVLSPFPCTKSGHAKYFLRTTKLYNKKAHLKSYHPEVVKVMEDFAMKDPPSIFPIRVEEVVKGKRNRMKTSPGAVMRSNVQSYFPTAQKVKKEKLCLKRNHRQELALVLFFVESENPLAGVDCKTFKQLKKECGVNWRSRTVLTSLLEPIYLVVVEKRKECLDNAGFFSITFDFWKGCGDDFLGITYHTIDRSWRHFSCILDLVLCPGKKYAPMVALQVKECVDSHTSTDCLLVQSTTDRAKNVLGASELLTGDDHQGCLNHELKKVIDDSLIGTPATPATAPLAAKMFSLILDISSFVRTNKAEARLFFDVQRNLSENQPLQLIIDNLTRWEGKYRSIQRFLQLRRSVRGLLKEKASTFTISLQQFGPPGSVESLKNRKSDFWVSAREVEEVLKVFHVVSKYAQGETFVTNSCVPYWIWQLQKACILTEGETATTSELKTALLGSLNRRCNYYLHESNNCLKAAALDPRFSALSLYGVQEEVISDVWVKVIDEAMQILNIPDGPDSEEEMSVQRNILVQQAQTVQRKLKIISETYLENTSWGDVVTKADPCHFWQQLGLAGESSSSARLLLVLPQSFQVPAHLKGHFRAFSETARMLLSLPPSSAPSEREFSGAGRVYDHSRESLGDKTLEMLVVIRDFIKSDEYDFDELVRCICDLGLIDWGTVAE
jgi:hypothetical protein